MGKAIDKGMRQPTVSRASASTAFVVQPTTSEVLTSCASSTSTTPGPLLPPALVASATGPKQTLDAMTIAERLIDFCHEHGDVVTNLKLQKLLYYCQAWYLALYGTPLFAQSFEAWPVGPVQPEVYSRYRSFADRPIERSRQEWHLPKKVEQHVEDLMASYGRLSAFELERLSCQESPWIEARHGLDADQWSDAKISAESMQRFYKARLDEQEKARG